MLVAGPLTRILLLTLAWVNDPAAAVVAPTVPLMLNAVAVPVMFVPTRVVGVPKSGVTNAGLVNSCVMVALFVTPLWTIGNRFAPATADATGRSEIFVPMMRLLIAKRQRL